MTYVCNHYNYGAFYTVVRLTFNPATYYQHPPIRQFIFNHAIVQKMKFSFQHKREKNLPAIVKLDRITISCPTTQPLLNQMA